MLARLAQEKNGRKQNGFGVAAADALAVLENIDLVVRYLNRDGFGLKQEKIFTVGVDVTVGFCRKSRDRSADVLDVIAVVGGESGKTDE